MIIAVDFDGVLHDYTKGWCGGKIYGDPVPGAREAMRELLRDGHQVWVFTARAFSGYVDGDRLVPGDAPGIRKWLKYHKIPYTSVFIGHGKLAADLYIDDRAIKFEGDWAQTLSQVAFFKTWQGHRTRNDEIDPPKTHEHPKEENDSVPS